jgi:hypothetical protein
MDTIYDFLVVNKLPVGGGLIVIVMLWDKMKLAFASVKGKIKLPSLSKTGPDQEFADQSAIRHLRDRAASFGDKELNLLIKEIDTRFYDIHSGVKNEK